MSRNISDHLGNPPAGTSAPNRDHKNTSFISSIPKPIKVGFFIAQAIILFSFPIEILAALIKLPSFIEAQANEGLILALCINIPFVIVSEILVWAAFVKKRMFLMIVMTMAPLIAMAILVYLAIYTV